MDNRTIIHVDMDAFYASVEKRDNPDLRGKPLIIGALPNERGVVATCSYEARAYGIHSAMNIKEAYRRCPDAVFMHPDMKKYKQVSRELHRIWESYADKTEYVASDEGYLDVTESQNIHGGARKIAYMIKARTFRELGLTCSIGIGYSKSSAKLASEEKKPNGFFQIFGPKDFIDLIIDRDVRVLHGVGKKTADRLKKLGFYTVRDLQNRRNTLIEVFGKQGIYIANLSLGIDDRPLESHGDMDAKSISREVTFQKDTNDFEYVKEVMNALAEELAVRLDKRGLFAKGVSIKLTYANMKSITRSKAVETIYRREDIYRIGVRLLDGVDKDYIRLIGLGLYRLSGKYQHQMSFEDLNIL